MATLPPIELLKATHTFPGTYHLKVIGTNGDDFVARALALVQDEMVLDKPPKHTTRETAGGRHVAVSLELPAQSAEQLHGVYPRMLTLSGLIMLL